MHFCFYFLEVIMAYKPRTTLKFEKPSSWWGALWREGLPLGNGLSGACVYGGAANETIMLTSAFSYWQGSIGVLPDISDKLKEVRKLLDEGKYSLAEKVYSDALINKNYRPQNFVPLPICDFKINKNILKPVKEYSRILNMENGEVVVSFKEGGTKFERSIFVSRANDLIVCEMTKSGSDAITVDFSFDLHDRKCALTEEGIYSRLPEAVTTKYEPYFMYFSARKDNGTEFGAVARVSFYGGSMEVKQNCISVKATNNILIIIKLFTESQREKEWREIKTLLAQNKLGYDKMLKEHTALHSKLLLSAELDLSSGKKEASVDDLLKECYGGAADAALIEKLWYFGRYLFISSAREDGKLLVNPYGLWCGDYKASSSCPDFNGSYQSIYRFALENNLCAMVLPFLNYFEGVTGDLKKNAQRLYDCKGIFIPARVSYGTGLPGGINAEDVYSVSVCGDIACMFYDYYLCTSDKKFLKEKAMPFMKEALAFYEDFLKTGEDGYYYSSPSYSPEGCPANLSDKESGTKINIARSSEIDFVVVRKLLHSIIEGSEISGLYNEETIKWKDMLAKLPPPKITPNGLVREYNSAEFAENYRTGSIGALYGVYPCENGSAPDMKKAYSNTLKKKISEGMGFAKCFTLAHFSNVASRLFDCDFAVELINLAIKSCVMANMVTAENDWRNMGYTDCGRWATYQISGNTSICAAVTSLFIFSDSKNIYILPCGQMFKSGSLKGILTKTGCEATIEWNNKFLKIFLKAKRTGEINIVLPNCCRKILKGPVTVFDEDKTIHNIAVTGGKSLAFEIRL
jgi:alpha-L-fucosidase 2